MSHYPDRHHPCYFLEDALTALGAQASVIRDVRTDGCWGLVVNGKTMVWLIDNRHSHEAATEDPAAKQLLEAGILVCHAQKPDAERVGGKWLPLAVTPGYKPPENKQDSINMHDVASVGYIRDAGRQTIFAHVARHFKLATVNGIFGDFAVASYWHSKVGLNVPTGYGQADAYDSANMRCFEILATGTPLVTPYEPYLAELGLIDMDNCCLYHSADDLIERLDLLINTTWDVGYGSKSADEIGSKGAKLAQERHTYEHRAKTVLEWLK